jgi:phage gp29-like protein
MAKVQRTPGGKAPNIVIQNITVKQVQRKSQDIELWRKAIKTFEDPANPVKANLYDLYEDIMLDGHLLSTWGKRVDAVLSRDLLFVRDGEPDEEITKLLNSPSMSLLIQDLIDSILWGYTLIQVNNIGWNEEENIYVVDYDLIPRKHVHPEFGWISLEQNRATADMLYREQPLSRTMLWAGRAKSLGLLGSIAQYVIYKRGNYGDWAQFAELFGMPFREASYEDYDDTTRQKLEQAMENYGGNSWMVRPKSADFKLHDAVKGTAGDLYKDLKDACNSEISKVILGNTLTTEVGSSGTQALGTVHQDNETIKNDRTRKYVLDILNGKFSYILQLYGFNTANGEIWFRSPQADWASLKTKWDVINGIANRVPVSDEYIYEEFDIPMPDNYEELRRAMDERQIVEVAGTPTNLATLEQRRTLFGRIKDLFL